MPTDTPTPAGTPTPIPTATSVPQLTTLWQGSGSEFLKTPPFQAADGQWAISWQCDASSGISYLVELAIYPADDPSESHPPEPTVNQICEAGNTSGTATPYEPAGSYFLQISTGGPWAFTVTGYQ